MNRTLLRVKMNEQEKDVTDICRACGFSRATFYRKLRGDTEFTRAEIAAIIRLLELDHSTTDRIFSLR